MDINGAIETVKKLNGTEAENTEAIFMLMDFIDEDNDDGKLLEEFFNEAKLKSNSFAEFTDSLIDLLEAPMDRESLDRVAAVSERTASILRTNIGGN